MRPVNRLRYSVVLMVIMILAFGTVTYAWITLSTINSIEGMSLTVSTGDELQISLDAEKYDTEITSEQLESLFENITLRDVTSNDGIAFKTGGLRDEGIATPNSDYLSFDLWFQTTEPIHTVYLVNNVSNLVSYDVSSPGTYVVSQGVDWTTLISFQNGPSINDVVESGSRDTYYGSQAVRMSFQELPVEENELDTRDESSLKTVIFDPSENPNRGFNKSYGAYSYFIQKTRIYISRPNVEPETIYDLSEFDPSNPYVTYNQKSLLLTLQETNETNQSGKTYFRGKLKVNIWIEGWDADSFDAIDKDRIKVQLQFKLLKYLEESPIQD